MADNRRLTEEQKRRIAEAHRKAAQGDRSAQRSTGTKSAASSSAAKRSVNPNEKAVSSGTAVSAGKNNSGKSVKANEKATGKNKLTTKMKRTIRRSVAGVCLASSLIIAALPTDRSGTAKAVDTGWEPSNESGLSYATASSDARNGGISQESFLERSSHTPDHCSFLIYGTDDNYSLDYQYEYYMSNPSGGSTGAVLADFNQATLNGQTHTGADPLVISDRVITAYSSVNGTVYTDWLADMGNRWFVVPKAEDANTSGLEINSYILDTATNTKTDEQTFEYALIKEFLPDPLDVETAVKMDSSNYPRFYCETHSHPDETIKKVRNNTKSNSGYKKYSADDDLYVFCTESNGNTEFLTDTTQLVVGIGEEAFGQYDKTDGSVHQAMANCNNVQISPQILYIGDRAFYNCSSLKKVDLGGIKVVGNGVFQHCNNLQTVYLSGDTELIGKEAFEGCTTLKTIGLQSDVDGRSGAVFPSGVKGYAFGSFANCSSLESVDFSKTSDNGSTIGEYAFYNLNDVSSISFPEGRTMSIGTAAFAVDNGGDNNLTDFTFPKIYSNYTSPSAPGGTQNYTFEYEDGKTYTSRIGDYILANRTALKDVTFQSLGTASVGYTDADKGDWQWVPYCTLQNCRLLETVTFSDDEGFVAFDERLFRAVEKEQFCVWGPAEASSYTTSDNKRYARPRICTWTAKANNNLDYVPYCYRSGDDVHYEVGMEDASSGCRYICDIITDRPASGEATLQNCIYYPGDEGTELGLYKQQPFTLPSKIGNYTLTQLGGFNEDARQCFDPELRNNIHHLKMEDGSVKYIGDGVFSGAEKLKSVTMASDIFKIGDQAFSNANNLEDVYWGLNSKIGSIGDGAFYTTGNKLYFHGNVTDSYYPFNYAMGENFINNKNTRICYVSDYDDPSSFSGGLCMLRDNGDNEITLIDYPHITDSNDPEMALIYRKLMGLSRPTDAWVTDDLWNNGELTSREQKMRDASMYIVLPAQVNSIDTVGFIEDRNNDMNMSYFADSIDSTGDSRKDLYGNDSLVNYPSRQEHHIGGYHAGLFSSETEENRDSFLETAANKVNGVQVDIPERIKGNDWIQSIKLTGVTEIPDYAFDSCENLQSVILSDDTQEIGKNVFQGCLALNNGGVTFESGNDRYDFDGSTGILYEKLSDGTRKVISCLPSVNNPIILDEDVSELNEEAFCGCESIPSFDLSKTPIVTIPERAFDHCRLASTYKLPESVDTIEYEAFDCSSDNVTIQIPNTGIMEIPDRAFDPDAARVLLRGYKGSVPEKKADRSSSDNIFFEEIGTVYTVTFRNDDNSIIEVYTIYLNENETSGRAEFPTPDPTPKLYPQHEGYSFSRWVWIGHEEVTGNDLIWNIQEDREITAFYEKEDVVTPQYTVTFKNDDGTVIRTDTVYEGSYINTPKNVTSKINPTYAFVGWSYQPSTFDENQTIKQDITATAKFSQDVYTVKLLYDDMSLFKEYTVEKGGYLPQLDIPEDSKLNPGKQFLGWKFTPTSFKATDRVTQDGIIGVATYSSSEIPEGFHSVTFFNDDNNVFMSYTVPDGGPIYDPGHPKDSGRHPNEGYTFDYWQFHPDNYGIGVAVSENVTVVAVWEYLEYKQPTATPKPSGSSNASGTPTPSTKATPTVSQNEGYLVTVENGAGTGRHKAGEVVTITAYAATEGKVFDRWTTSNADIGFSNAYSVATTFIMPTHDVKVTATYKSANATPTVSGNAAKATATPAPGNSNNNNNNNGNSVSGNNSKTQPSGDNNGTEVRITTDTIDNNNKNLGTASVSGSTDNFVVKVTDSAAASAAVEQALRNAYGSRFQDLKYVGFDISLYDSTGTRKVENANNLAVTITLPIPDQLVPYAGNNKAAAIANGQVEPLAVQYTTIDGVPCMRFTATHFSPYTIYVDTQNLVRGVSDITPKTGDGIAPKWFLSAGMLSLSCVLFLWKDKKPVPKARKK